MIEQDGLNLILLNAGKAEHYADWNWKNVSSPFFRLYLVEEGSAQIEITGKQYQLNPGHLYLVPPFTEHSDVCTGHFSLCYLHVYEEQTRSISLFEQLIFPVEVAASPLDALLMKRLLEINPERGLKRYDPDSYNNSLTLFKSIAENTQQEFYTLIETSGIIRQLLSRFLASAVRRDAIQDSRIQKALRYIREHIDQKISVCQLSSLCYLSDDHFIRLFKHEVKSTPVDYINRKKVEKAQLMIVVENLSIKDIAYSLSFEDVSYFNRLFKKIVGKTPTQYKAGFASLSKC